MQLLGNGCNRVMEAVVQNMTTVMENMTMVKSQMETCVQMQLFGTFMLILGLYDVAVNVRRHIRDQLALHWARPRARVVD